MAVKKGYSIRKNILVKYERDDGEFEIPEGVLGIGTGAFKNCKHLTRIKIPNSVTSIGYEAFRECTGLSSIELPDSITAIGCAAFYGCSGLTSIKIPRGVTEIASGAFEFCGNLTAIEIPRGVTFIGKPTLTEDPTSENIGQNFYTTGVGTRLGCPEEYGNILTHFQSSNQPFCLHFARKVFLSSLTQIPFQA